MSNVEKILDKNKINYKVYSYSHNENNLHFAQEASEKMWIELWRIFKTLVVDAEWIFYVVVLSSEKQLDLKWFAKILWIKKVKMGEKNMVEKITGYIFWGISPIGQKKKLKTFVDINAKNYETIYISAGNRWVEVELKADDLVKLLSGKFIEI